jgi:diguanylate cyclase (GGDEF)-like protein
MAALPMLSAMFARPGVCGVTAILVVVVAMGVAAQSYGQQFSDAIPVLLAVIVASGVAVMSSQLKTPTRPRQRPIERPRADHVEPSADVDPLTGLPTRAAVERMYQGPNTLGPKLIAFIDVDGIAQVNATHGREIGDVFLFAVAGRTRYALPDADLVCRWGDDEFVVVADADAEAGRPLFDLITDKVNVHPIRTDSGLLPATMSVGVASWQSGEELQAAVARAHRAMYRAKSLGGGQLAFDLEA